MMDGRMALTAGTNGFFKRMRAALYPIPFSERLTGMVPASSAVFAISKAYARRIAEALEKKRTLQTRAARKQP